MVQLLGEAFSIHPLILESVVDIHQRPKYEEHDKGNFIILKALSFDKNKIEVKKEHVALYFNFSYIYSSNFFSGYLWDEF